MSRAWREDCAPPCQIEQLFEAEIETEEGGRRTVQMAYLLFLPRGYGSKPDHAWPLILYLHGIGERGSELSLVKTHGIAKVVEQMPGFRFVSVSPQCPDDTVWANHEAVLDAMLDAIVPQYAVDVNRIYLTGNSMGGYGTWSLAAAYPERFAALAPICGGGEPDSVCALSQVPVWAFHGAEDPLVPVEATVEMVDALRACGGRARLTVYPGVQHDSWTRTYENPELYDWFLRHSR
jgi:predicted peptidase